MSLALFHWVAFILMVILFLALDLGVFHRRQHVIGAREALGWTFFWISLSLLFNGFIYYAYAGGWLGLGAGAHGIASGGDAALKYFTGYIIEKSLSLDNIFVIALIFAYFRVDALHQHRVLFWGILGALVMRGAMIMAGVALIERFEWMIYVFGAFLIVTAIKMLVTREDGIDPEKNILIRIVRKLLPVSPSYEGAKFFTRVNGACAITPLFIVLLVVESMDVVFAVDSIPAIFSVTTDPYIVFTSNIFAILGLRSLYFALAAMMGKFRFLRVSIVIVLLYVGVKMLLSHHYPIPTLVSLGVIAAIITAGTLASVVFKKSSQGKL